jgi:hypothetical protein
MNRVTIGIDPGPREFAWVEWDGSRVVRCGDCPNVEFDVLLTSVAERGQTWAIEWIESFGMAVGREVFETVFSIGAMATAAANVCHVRLVPRRDVKLHLCASPRAKDGNIRQALIDRFGIVGTKNNPGPLFGISNHRWAALAVAVTAHDIERTEHEARFHVEEHAA